MTNSATEKRNLEQSLQALYDSEIKVTITMLWDSSPILYIRDKRGGRMGSR